MGELTTIIKTLQGEVQERCADRIKKAQALAVNKISFSKPEEDYGISSILKRKHGL
jgi:hypothetical protein